MSSDAGGERTGRRFEAMVLVVDSAAPLSAAAPLIAALRLRGFIAAVIAPPPLAELAAALGAAPPDAAPPDAAPPAPGTLLLAGAGGSERAVADEEGLHELLHAQVRVEPAALEEIGLVVAERLALVGFSPTVEPLVPERPLTVALGQYGASADGQTDAEILSIAIDAAHDAGIDDPHVTLVDARLSIAAAGEAAAVRWALDELWDRGVAPGDVLVVGRDERDALGLLAEQVRRRDRREPPLAGADPGWCLVVDGFDPELERGHSALLALGDGRVGTSGAPLFAHASANPWVLAAGVYQGSGPESRLLTAPVGLHLPYPLAADTELRRVLDLRAGLLHERMGTSSRALATIAETGRGAVSSVRFASLSRPGAVVLRATCPDARVRPLLLPPVDDDLLDEGTRGTARWMRVAGSGGGGINAAAVEVDSPIEGGRVVDRVIFYDARPDVVPVPDDAVASARAVAASGFDQLLAEHRRAWAARWRDADIAIEGDNDLQVATRFNLFHLIGSVADEDEAAVGARGLTGPGYRGHVFWDADAFVLPFFAATHPAAARAMLEYRIRRLPAALQAAREVGRAGARFPWESAQTGRDVTPSYARDRRGRVVPIRTGLLEEHIVAQVPWAAGCYTDWTGDDEFAHGPGLRLLLETARYWSSRIRVTGEGSAHIYGVIGPDEYHEPVDDNAFTNVAARWNLRRAADAADAADSAADAGSVTAEEIERWRVLADALVDGYDPDTGIYEQFAGFETLEPLIIAEAAPRRPIAADLLLGSERVHRAQVIKQADVLMLHHLLPDEVAAGSLEPNLRYYEPRTAHGSSLSPAIHASLHARARDYRPALEALRMASRIDLDDLTGTTAGGLHLATMGGLWQAFAWGFMGLRPRDGRLTIDPRLPPDWASLDIRVRFRGSRVRIRCERGRVVVSASPPVAVLVDSSPYRATPTGLVFHRRGPNWRLAR